MKFVKTEALGNDFLLVEEEEWGERVEADRRIQSLCDRRRGIGADGLIAFSVEEGARCRMKLYNSDGSPAEVSGNGVRCLGAYLLHSGRIAQTRLTIETAAGPRRLELVSRRGTWFSFRSDLGVPRLASADIPFAIDPPSETVIDFALDVEGRAVRITALSMGNPQCVTFTDRLDFAVLRDLGPRIERHPRFPRRTNVEFVQVIDSSRLSIGIWERGAGETAASGTGAAAAAVAACLGGKTGRRVLVHSPGGDLDVEWREEGDVTVTGEATVVAEGVYRKE